MYGDEVANEIEILLIVDAWFDFLQGGDFGDVQSLLSFHDFCRSLGTNLRLFLFFAEERFEILQQCFEQTDVIFEIVEYGLYNRLYFQIQGILVALLFIPVYCGAGKAVEQAPGGMGFA